MRTGSVCTGYGGLDRAVHEVMGGELAWVADIDPGASAILAHRFPSLPNLGDISAADWSAIEPVDVLTAGFPCQDVSCAGGRAGLREGNRTGVWAYVARAIDELRPSLVVLENVRGLLSAGADSDVESCPWCLGESGMEHALRACGAVLGDLADLFYDTRGAVVSAADAGAPHRRERVFIVAWPAADAGGRELQRRGIARVLGSASASQLGEGDQRERAGDAAGDSGSTTLADAAVSGRMGGGSGHLAGSGRTPVAAQRPGRLAPQHNGLASQGLAATEDPDRAASSERRQPAPGQAPRGRSRANAGGSGGAPTTADACGAGLEVGAVEPDRHERQAAERGRGDAPADAYGQDAGPHAGRSGEAASAGPGDGPEWRCIPGPGVGGGAAADPQGDGRDEGRPEPAGIVGGPDAAVGSDELCCPSCGCTTDFHDHGGFCAGPCGGNCADPELGRPDGGWNSFEDDADPADVRAYALAYSKGVGYRDTGPQGERGLSAAAIPGAPADAASSAWGGPEPEHLAAAPGRAAEPGERPGAIAWGAYEPAIRRWEAATGRHAPPPTEPGRTGQRLSPRFVEWMMGLPEGWVTDVPGLSRNAQLKALGNGVVPQQAAMALRLLLDRADIAPLVAAEGAA